MFGELGEYAIVKSGRELRQQCIANQKRPIFTGAAIGEGKPNDPSEVDTLTDLVSYAKDIILKKSYILAGENHIHIVRVDNAGYIKDILCTEIAVFAKMDGQEDDEKVLYGYAYIPEGYKRFPQQTSETNHKVNEFVLDTNISRSEKVEIKYDYSGVFVSHADLDDALKYYFPTDKIATVTHSLGRTPIGSLYRTEYAVGAQRAGEGPAGGGDVFQIPCRLNHVDVDRVEVYTIPGFLDRGQPEVYRLSETRYGIFWPGYIDNLLLVMNGGDMYG